MTYEQFRDKTREVLESSDRPLTWTEVRTTASFPQMYPNNRWVRRMERDIGLIRQKDSHGIMHWSLET